MTVPELIHDVLGTIRRQFYCDQPERNFFRDENELRRAVARYGYACEQRGWHFDSRAILAELMQLLNEIKRTGADIHYFPRYLAGAVDRHIGQRAEELSAQAKALDRRVKRAVSTVQPVVVVEKTDTEVLATVYRDLTRLRRRRSRPGPAARELSLF